MQYLQAYTDNVFSVNGVLDVGNSAGHSREAAHSAVSVEGGWEGFSWWSYMAHLNQARLDQRLKNGENGENSLLLHRQGQDRTSRNAKAKGTVDGGAQERDPAGEEGAGGGVKCEKGGAEFPWCCTGIHRVMMAVHEEQQGGLEASRMYGTLAISDGIPPNGDEGDEDGLGPSEDPGEGGKGLMSSRGAHRDSSRRGGGDRGEGGGKGGVERDDRPKGGVERGQGQDVDEHGPAGGKGGEGGEGGRGRGRGRGGEGQQLTLDSLTRSQKDGEILKRWCSSVFTMCLLCIPTFTNVL